MSNHHAAGAVLDHMIDAVILRALVRDACAEHAACLITVESQQPCARLKISDRVFKGLARLHGVQFNKKIFILVKFRLEFQHPLNTLIYAGLRPSGKSLSRRLQRLLRLLCACTLEAFNNAAVGRIFDPYKRAFARNKLSADIHFSVHFIPPNHLIYMHFL